MTTKKAFLIISLSLFAATAITLILLTSELSEESSTITAQTFKTEHGWGYDILQGKRIVIHQPIIPGKAGMNGFKTEKEAREAAQIVIGNLKLAKKQ